MKKFLLVLPVIALLAFAPKVIRDKVTYTGRYKVEYEMLNGRRDGSYTSWYLNGKKRTEGAYHNNMRCEEWTLWDSTGRVRMKRTYTNDFQYTQTFPKVAEGPAKLFSGPVYRLNYNKQGYIEWFPLQERAVAISKRIWRFVPVADKISPLAVNNNQLFAAMRDSAINGTLKIYADEEFQRDGIATRIFAFKSVPDSVCCRLIGYKIKEDWFFDSDRMLSETRIVGICPVTLNSGTGDTTNVGWFYFPELRPTLAAIKMPSLYPAHVRTLDDVFFFRYFHGDIYRESNTYNRDLKEYGEKVKLDEERLRIECELVEMEHDEWLRFSPQE